MTKFPFQKIISRSNSTAGNSQQTRTSAHQERQKHPAGESRTRLDGPPRRGHNNHDSESETQNINMCILPQRKLSEMNVISSSCRMALIPLNCGRHHDLMPNRYPPCIAFSHISQIASHFSICGHRTKTDSACHSEEVQLLCPIHLLSIVQHVREHGPRIYCCPDWCWCPRVDLHPWTKCLMSARPPLRLRVFY